MLKIFLNWKFSSSFSSESIFNFHRFDSEDYISGRRKNLEFNIREMTCYNQRRMRIYVAFHGLAIVIIFPKNLVVLH